MDFWLFGSNEAASKEAASKKRSIKSLTSIMDKTDKEIDDNKQAKQIEDDAKIANYMKSQRVDAASRSPKSMPDVVSDATIKKRARPSDNLVGSTNNMSKAARHTGLSGHNEWSSKVGR